MTAENGGAFKLSQSSLSSSNMRITNALASKAGGVVHATQWSTLTTFNSTIEKTTSKIGGVGYVENSFVQWTNGSVVNSNANDGAVLYCNPCPADNSERIDSVDIRKIHADRGGLLFFNKCPNCVNYDCATPYIDNITSNSTTLSVKRGPIGYVNTNPTCVNSSCSNCHIPGLNISHSGAGFASGIQLFGFTYAAIHFVTNTCSCYQLQSVWKSTASHRLFIPTKEWIFNFLSWTILKMRFCTHT